MKKTPDLEIDYGKTLKIIEKHNLILDEKNSNTDHPHILSVLILSEKTDPDTPVLWLDGDNSFNPYKISELSRKLALNSEHVLQEIYISRAFTCYQMKSLILEKLEDAIKKYQSDLTVITGLPKLFSESDLKEKEALRVFYPVVETLKNFRKIESTILLTSPNSEENRFISNLRSISNQVIGFNREKPHARKRIGNPSNLPRKNTSSKPTVKTPTLEEFA